MESLGLSVGYWLQTVAFVSSAIFAGWQIRALRKQNESNDTQWRQRATIDAVMTDRKDERLMASRLKYAKMREERENFDLLGSTNLLDNEEKHSAILDILNNYEFMAAGIREGAFDEEIYRRMKCSLIIRDWDVLEVYIVATRKRESRPKLFIELEWLAKKWKVLEQHKH